MQQKKYIYVSSLIKQLIYFTLQIRSFHELQITLWKLMKAYSVPPSYLKILLKGLKPK